MKAKITIAGAFGVVLGAGLVLAFHGLIPFYQHLPAGGERCTNCHDLHGAVHVDDISCDAWIALTGDVPEPSFIDTAQLFRTHTVDNLPGVTIRDLLFEHHCRMFQHIVILSGDGGHVAIDSADLTESARLVPHLNAPRFADERLHESAWLRGVTEICVVADAPVIRVNGHETTFGALLAGDRMTVVTEPGRSAVIDKSTGQRRRNVTSHLVAGVALRSILDAMCTTVVITTDTASIRFDSDELRDAVIARDAHTNAVILAVPAWNRDAWPANLTAVDCAASTPSASPVKDNE